MSKEHEQKHSSEKQEPKKKVHTEDSTQQPEVQTVPLQQYEELKKQADMYLNTAKYVQADFDNYKRHNQNAYKEGVEEGVKRACEVILPALDNFKKAEKVVHEKNCLEGIKMIEQTILSELEKLKIKRIPAIGKKFDPSLHNAIALIEDNSHASDTIVEEVQSGYTYDGKVIRYSQVVVAK